MRYIDVVVKKTVEAGIITCDEAPWLQYALEKRAAVLILLIPLLYIGARVSSLKTVVSFYISCRSVRSYTNGIHANSFAGCVLGSIMWEVVFLGILRCMLSIPIKNILMLISLIVIWSLAPYNHSNMELSKEEVQACAAKAKKRTILTVAVAIGLYIFSVDDIADGISLGVVMTSMMLVLSYIL